MTEQTFEFIGICPYEARKISEFFFKIRVVEMKINYGLLPDITPIPLIFKDWISVNIRHNIIISLSWLLIFEFAFPRISKRRFICRIFLLGIKCIKIRLLHADI